MKKFSIRTGWSREALVVAGKSADFPVARQMLLNVFEGDWSNGGHLWIQASEPGQHVDLKLPTAEAKAQTLVMWLTKAPDYGIVQFSVNGNPVGEPVDLYAERVEPSGPVRVGMFTPTGRETTVRVEIVGKNARSRGAFAGIDAVKLEAAW